MKKRLISMFLVLVMALGMFPISAFAASSTIAGALGEVNITNGDYKMSYLSMNGVVRSQSYTYFNFKSASGAFKEIPAYCINPTTKGVPQSVSPGTSIKYIANEASNDPKIVGIIANGYPHRGLSELKLENKYQAYYATKMALWCYLIDGWSIDRLTVNPSLSGVEKERGEKLLAAAKDIYKRGIWWNRVPQPTITVTADKDSAYPVTIDGKEYLQQVFTADSETWVCDYDIDIGFTMPDEVPEGTRIVDMNNNDITKIRTSSNGASYAGQFKVLYPKDSVSDQTGAVQMSLHANVYKYAIYYALCAETSKYGTLQRYMCDTDPTTEIRQSTFSRYSSTPSDTPDEPETPTETTLIINKVATGTNTPLSGATFEVKAPDGTVLGSFVTDTSGKIIIPLTLSGQYVITEKAAPKWHLLGTETTKTVSVDYGNTATVTFENAPYGNLRVDKIDADSGASLAGATVEIKHIESGVTQTGTTDLGGSVYFDKLKPGAYQVREVSAPGGYVKDDQTYTVNVTSGTETSFVLKNQAKPGLIITKYDEQTHEVLPDVTFEVTRDSRLFSQTVKARVRDRHRGRNIQIPLVVGLDAARAGEGAALHFGIAAVVPQIELTRSIIGELASVKHRLAVLVVAHAVRENTVRVGHGVFRRAGVAEPAGEVIGAVTVVTTISWIRFAQLQVCKTDIDVVLLISQDCKTAGDADFRIVVYANERDLGEVGQTSFCDLHPAGISHINLTTDLIGDDAVFVRRRRIDGVAKRTIGLPPYLDRSSACRPLRQGCRR